MLLSPMVADIHRFQVISLLRFTILRRVFTVNVFSERLSPSWVMLYLFTSPSFKNTIYPLTL